MWTAPPPPPLESSSPSKLHGVSLTPDGRPASRTALHCTQEPDVVSEDWVDCGGCDGTDAERSWYRVHDDDDEADLFDDTLDFISHPDNPVIYDDSCQSLLDAVDSHAAGPVDESSGALPTHRQPSPTSCSAANLQTWSPYHRRNWESSGAERDGQPVTPTGQRTPSLTTQEVLVLSGAAPFSITYKGRRLRHIAPKPSSDTDAAAALPATRHQSFAPPPLPHHRSLPPKITFSVVFAAGPSSSTVTTTTPLTSGDCTGGADRATVYITIPRLAAPVRQNSSKLLRTSL